MPYGLLQSMILRDISWVVWYKWAESCLRFRDSFFFSSLSQWERDSAVFAYWIDCLLDRDRSQFENTKAAGAQISKREAPSISFQFWYLSLISFHDLGVLCQPLFLNYFTHIFEYFRRTALIKNWIHNIQLIQICLDNFPFLPKTSQIFGENVCKSWWPSLSLAPTLQLMAT